MGDAKGHLWLVSAGKSVGRCRSGWLDDSVVDQSVAVKAIGMLDESSGFVENLRKCSQALGAGDRNVLRSCGIVSVSCDPDGRGALLVESVRLRQVKAFTICSRSTRLVAFS